MADKLRQIEAFLQVAKSKNFTRAGEAIGLSQPALSALIAQFEEEIGLKLFNRTTRTVELTGAGLDFLPDAERIMQDVNNSLDTLKDTAALLRGRVRIAALPSLCSMMIPHHISHFLKSFPGIEVNVDEVLAAPLVEHVVSGRCDFGIGILPSDREGIRFRPVFEEELVLLCRVSDALAKQGSVPWSALVDRPIIAMKTLTSVRAAVDQAAMMHDLSLDIAYEFEFMATAIGFVRAGLGVTILPSVALADFDREDIKVVRLTSPVVKREIGILQRADHLLSPAAGNFADLFAKTAVTY